MKITGPIRWYYADSQGRELPPGDDAGLACLELGVDGVRTLVPTEQKLLRFGAVFLGADAEGLTSFAVPADPADGRTLPLLVAGATDDPAAVGLVTEFLDAVEAGTFTRRTVAA